MPKPRSLYTMIAVLGMSAMLGACNQTAGLGGEYAALGPAPSKEALREQSSELGKAYAANPEDVPTAWSYAQTLRGLGNTRQEQAVLEQVVLRTNGDRPAMAAYGKSLLANGEYARADEVLAQSYTPDQPDWRAISARGVIADKLGDHPRARKFYEEALAIVPGEPGVLTNLALSYGFSRDYGRAEVLLRQAIQSPAAGKRTYDNLVLILGMQGKTEEQKVILDRVANLHDATEIAAATQELRKEDATNPLAIPPAPERPVRKARSARP